jgi:hypothetical protein
MSEQDVGRLVWRMVEERPKSLRHAETGARFHATLHALVPVLAGVRAELEVLRLPGWQVEAALTRVVSRMLEQMEHAADEDEARRVLLVAELEKRAPVPVPSITCPTCGRTSWNPNDVRERYCGNCHAYHADMPRAGAS